MKLLISSPTVKTWASTIGVSPPRKHILRPNMAKWQPILSLVHLFKFLSSPTLTGDLGAWEAQEEA